MLARQALQEHAGRAADAVPVPQQGVRRPGPQPGPCAPSLLQARAVALAHLGADLAAFARAHHAEPLEGDQHPLARAARHPVRPPAERRRDRVPCACLPVLASHTRSSPPSLPRARPFTDACPATYSRSSPQDLGNTNYSIMVPKDIFDRRPNAELVTRALQALGVPAEVNHRSDITLDGAKMSLPARARRRWRRLTDHLSACALAADIAARPALVPLHLGLGVQAQQPARVPSRDDADRRAPRPARRRAPIRPGASTLFPRLSSKRSPAVLTRHAPTLNPSRRRPSS